MVAHRLAYIVQQFRMAQQLVGKVGTVFEDIEHAGGERRIPLQPIENFRCGECLLQEVVEALPSAIQARRGDYFRQPGRALVQQPRQIAGRRRGLLFYHFRQSRRSVVERLLCVNDAIVNLLHRRKMLG